MPEIYVVRRTFKAGGKLYKIGSLIEDLSSVHRHTLRIKERKIELVPTSSEEAFNRYTEAFQKRTGIDLAKQIKERASKGSKSAETEKPSASAKPTNTGTKPKETGKVVEGSASIKVSKPKPVSKPSGQKSK